MSKIQDKILKLSNEILEYLLEFKKQNPDFTFSLRQRDSVQSKGVKRLALGQWFQGADYIYVPLFNRGDNARKIKTIGFVVSFKDDGSLNNYIEISFKEGNFSPDEVTFHKKLASHINLNLSKNNHGTKSFKTLDIWENLENYITDFRNYAIKLLEEYDLKDKYIIKEIDFQKGLKKILTIRKTLFPISINNSQNILPKTSPKMLNQILYGPPGTGKTYHIINKAIEIINPKFDLNQDREILKKEYDRLIDEGLIVFTTFHQSMAYEDFIEGIKPLKPNSSNVVQYDVISGVFKTISQNALANFIENSKGNQSSLINSTFDSLHQSFLEYLRPNVMKNKILFHTINNKEIKLIDIKGSTIIVKFVWYNKEKGIEATEPFSVTKSKLKMLFDANMNPHEIKNMKESFAPFFKHNLSVFYAVYREFYDFIINIKGYNPSSGEDDINLSNTYEELLENFDFLTKEEIELGKLDSNKYLLIIDEINRGNVSQIFGELITLIEESKRLGNDEALKVTLPYSKEIFGIPPNLYIIGTMNTADRSVEALDTALRRRFSFEEMMPKTNLITPSAMYCRLLWKYQSVGWASKEYQEKEKELFDLLGVSDELKQKRKEIWGIMKSENQRDNLTYFDHFIFNGVDLKKILDTINKRIEYLIGSDHTIGHSYFISVNSLNDLKTVFQDKIIPLLQEYFFGDYGKIGLVLGKGFVKLKEYQKETTVFADFDTDSATDFEERNVYEIIDYRVTDDFVLKIKNTEVSM
ncbi:MAG: AAA family ATPase, partial [Flavobacterium sp.]|nr:AAA family ATPase [Flavobacterium sp.]